MTTKAKSQEINRQLIKMHQQNITREEQADRLGLDVKTVDRRRRALNLSKRRFVSDDDRALVIELKRVGKTTNEVARLTGVNKHTITSIWQKINKSKTCTHFISELLKNPVNQLIASNWKTRIELNWQEKEAVA